MPEGGFLLANAFESGPPCCSICARLQVHRRDLAQVHSKPFPFRSPEGRVARVIEVEKARYTKLTFEHTPTHQSCLSALLGIANAWQAEGASVQGRSKPPLWRGV